MERRTLALNVSILSLFLVCALFIMSGSALAAWPWEPQYVTDPLKDLANLIAKMVFGIILAVGGIVCIYFGTKSKQKGAVLYGLAVCLFLGAGIVILGVI